MKLISCYIENFGCLHKLTVQFNDGLTVINAPNGFGKTTLAEFIRAMFYGFPRAAKDLQKNPRQKYAPWQGGQYGGWLVFQQGSKRYRIERSFGDQPRQDKFRLLDEDSRRDSSDYSENIGTELFGIDADSFLRSTYMPQSPDSSAQSTDSLRAKLGNLLEDSNDLAGYEKAIARLKERRSKFENYRDGKGSITRTQSQISRLETDIARVQGLQTDIDQSQTEIDRLTRSRSAKATALQEVREQMTLVVQLQADAALQQQFDSLLRRHKDSADALTDFAAPYPQGLPTDGELDTLARGIDHSTQLTSLLEPTQADKDAQQLVAQYAPHFARHQPTEEEMAARQQDYEDYLALQAKAEASLLSEGEQQLLTALERLFAPGVPEEEWFTARSRQVQELHRLQAAGQSHALPAPEAARLQALQSFFRRGVPEEAALDFHQEQLDRARALTAALPEELPVIKERPKRFHSLFFPALIPAVLAACAGLFLLILGIAQPALVLPDEQYVPLLNVLISLGIPAGAGCMAVGALLGALAGVLQSKQAARSREIAAALDAANLAQRRREEAAELKEETAAFIARYPVTNGDSLSRALSEIRSSARLYQALRVRSEELSLSARELTRQQETLTMALQSALRPYSPTGQDYEQTLRNLRDRKQRYEQLRQKHSEVQSRRSRCLEECSRLEQTLQQFLAPYFGPVQPEQFTKALVKLQAILDSYTGAQAHLAAREPQLKALRQEQAHLQQQMEQLLAPYGLPTPSRTGLQDLYAARRTLALLQQSEAAARKDVDDFRAAHGAHLTTVIPKDLTNLEHLKIQERSLTQNLDTLTDMIARRSQQLREVQQEMDTLPALQDELARQQQSKAEDSAKRQTLDYTIAFLQQARESLSATYMDKVEERFAHYLHQLTGESPEAVVMNSDLEVQLERNGQRRNLGYFSAGQQDMIDLCMRLALADALFQGEPCFMILDDPFVNLDDAHTRQALSLLKELAADRQFIYLVCHSSRTVKGGTQ